MVAVDSESEGGVKKPCYWLKDEEKGHKTKNGAASLELGKGKEINSHLEPSAQLTFAFNPIRFILDISSPELEDYTFIWF